jgi:hypothetical protein
MMKIALAVVAAAAVLTTTPLVTPAKAQGVDVQIGRDRYDRYDRDRRSDTTVGLGPGGVTIGPRQRCRMETTTIERDDGRMITRRERRCANPDSLPTKAAAAPPSSDGGASTHAKRGLNVCAPRAAV